MNASHNRNAENPESNKTPVESNQIADELIGTSAHQMRNSLAAIMMLTEQVQQASDSGGEKGMILNLIKDHVRQANDVLTELLNAYALTSGAIVLKKSAVDVGWLVSVMGVSYHYQARRKSQTLELSLEHDCIVYGDENRLRDVIDNLVGNAMKFSPKGARLFISVSRDADNVRFKVRDEGPGLTDVDKQLLFQRFHRLSARPTDGESSTGLGLAIVKRLMDLHGGKVWAVSDGQGSGSTFVAALPLMKPRPFPKKDDA
jgi:signal transduction histidine kinase